MTEAEKFEAQGRAYACLKQAKSNIALLHAVFLDYGHRWQKSGDLGASIGDARRSRGSATLAFSDDILSLGGKCKTLALDLPDPATLARQLDELASEAERVKELQALVDQF